MLLLVMAPPRSSTWSCCQICPGLGSGTRQLWYLWVAGLARVALQVHLLSQRWLDHQVWLHLICDAVSQSIMCNRVVQSSVSPWVSWVSPFPQSLLASHFTPTKTALCSGLCLANASSWLMAMLSLRMSVAGMWKTNRQCLAQHSTT